MRFKYNIGVNSTDFKFCILKLRWHIHSKLNSLIISHNILKTKIIFALLSNPFIVRLKDVILLTIFTFLQLIIWLFIHFNNKLTHIYNNVDKFNDTP